MNPAIHEPADHLLDALIDLIESRRDDEPSLAAWAVEALADGLGLAVVIINPTSTVGRARRPRLVRESNLPLIASGRTENR